MVPLKLTEFRSCMSRSRGRSQVNEASAVESHMIWAEADGAHGSIVAENVIATH